MLIKCPECDLQVSDKAKTCPHCGFPIVQPTITRPETPKNAYRAKKLKLPNGFGQISLIKGKNLRNPYRVMVTVGKNEYGKPISKLLKPQAYFHTYNDAYAALIEYNKDPYDLGDSMTLSELYEKWLPECKKKYTSPSSIRTVTSAWAYCSPLYNMNVRTIRARHIKLCISESNATPQLKFRMKSLLNILFDYAVEYELAEKNWARTFGMSAISDAKIEKTDHIAFTDDEMKILWNHTDSYIVKLILFQCYTGLRPAEMCNLKRENVNIIDRYFTGGMKTDAGTDRTVPINKKILETAKKIYERSESRGSEWFVCDESGEYLSYDRYYKSFKKVMKDLNLNGEHRPHDPRKTFITMAKNINGGQGINEYALKRVIGHAITDITESVYTERDIQWLINEVDKI